MAEELGIYTGRLSYRGIDFTFVFDGEELRLVPPKDKEREIRTNWLRTPIVKGVYTFGGSR